MSEFHRININKTKTMPVFTINNSDEETIDVRTPGSNVPAFLVKLWKMVEDPKTDDLISWGTSGKSFIILNQTQFAKKILPSYYKHNNIASFIRQLNMYGFHKIISTTAGSLESVDNDEIEFSHAYFIKGRQSLLENIKRKLKDPKESLVKCESTPLIQDNMKRILNDMKQLKVKQNDLSLQFSSVKQENEILWRELAKLRQKHSNQQVILNKLIRFLIQITSTPTTKQGIVNHRTLPLMLKDSSNNQKIESDSSNNEEDHLYSYTNNQEELNSPGPIIHEINPSEVTDISVVDSADFDEESDVTELGNFNDGTKFSRSKQIVIPNARKILNKRPMYITPDTSYKLQVARSGKNSQLTSNEYIVPERKQDVLHELVRETITGDDDVECDEDREYITVMPEEVSQNMLYEINPSSILNNGSPDSDIDSQEINSRTTTNRRTRSSDTNSYVPSKKGRLSQNRNITNITKSPFLVDVSNDPTGVISKDNLIFNSNSPNEPIPENLAPGSSSSQHEDNDISPTLRKVCETESASSTNNCDRQLQNEITQSSIDLLNSLTANSSHDEQNNYSAISAGVDNQSMQNNEVACTGNSPFPKLYFTTENFSQELDNIGSGLDSFTQLVRDNFNYEFQKVMQNKNELPNVANYILNDLDMMNDNKSIMGNELMGISQDEDLGSDSFLNELSSVLSPYVPNYDTNYDLNTPVIDSESNESRDLTTESPAKKNRKS